MKFNKIGILADGSEASQALIVKLMAKYKFIDFAKMPEAAVDILIVLGGDGFMLHSIHNHHKMSVPFYGINCGSLGFLLNQYNAEENLIDKLNSTIAATVNPLTMNVTTEDGKTSKALAFNEVSLLRQTNQTAHLQIHVDNKLYLNELICDGMLVSTPAGSSAYNYSAGGRIIPLCSNIISLTPLSPFRPRRWPGALLSDNTHIIAKILDHKKRPISATADFREFRNVTEVSVKMDKETSIKLLFDKNHSLEERMLREQFAY